MKTKLTLVLLGLALTTSNAFAAESLLDKTNKLCFSAIDGASMDEMGFKPFEMVKEVPFMTSAYEGELDGDKALVFMGERFGGTLCDVNLPEANAETYKAVHSELLNQFGVNGENYDQPNSATGYMGEIWADKETMSGPIENLEIEGMDLGSVFVQFAKKPFMQTADRTGFIISYSTR